MTKKEAGSKGGKTTVLRYGANYMQTIGYCGYLRNLELNYYNDKELYCAWLKAIGTHVKHDRAKFMQENQVCEARR